MHLDALIESVKSSLERAEKNASRLSRLNTSLLILSIVTSAATTLVTGITAAQGPVVGEGVPGWRAACIMAAILAFLTTVSVGINQQLKIGGKLARANECAGRLRSLQISLDAGSRKPNDISEEYEDVVRTFTDALKRS